MKILTTILLILANYLSAEVNEIDAISLKYRQWIVGSAQLDFEDPLVSHRYQSILSYAKSGHEAYDNYQWNPDEPFDLKTDQKEARSIQKDVLFPMTLAYHSKGNGSNPDFQNEETLKKIIKIYNYLHKKGWEKGINLNYRDLKSYKETGIPGFGGTIGNNLMGYSLSVFLNKKELKAHDLLQRELATLDWFTGIVGPQHEVPKLWEVTGYNTDAVRSMMNNRLAYILSMEQSDSRQKEAAYFQRLLNKALQISEGWADFIRPDFSVWHHKNAYLNAYGPGGLHSSALYIWLLKGTQFQVDEQAKSNVAQGLLKLRLCNQKYDIPRGVSGRFPNTLGTLVGHLPAFAYMAQIETPFQQELAGAFARLWDPSLKGFQTSFLPAVEVGISYYGSLEALRLCQELALNSTPEASPNGYWYQPFSGLALYRQKDWMVSIKGTSNYIWNYESGNAENVYGRNLSSGAIQIYAGGSPISSEQSGYGVKGMNWSQIPGTTTLDLPQEELLLKNKQKHRLFTEKSFLGGTSFYTHNSSIALYGLDHQDPYSSLGNKQSVLMFDDLLLVMGSGISSKDESSKTQTTLFQTRRTIDPITTADEQPDLEGAQHVATSTKPFSIVDPQGHSYIVYGNSEVLVTRGIQRSKLGKGVQHEGHFATARIIHGKNPTDSKYSYLIKVRGGKTGCQSLVEQPKHKVLKHDSSGHIVSLPDYNVTAYTLFNKGDLATMTTVQIVSAPCLILERSESKFLHLAVSNPDMGKTPNLSGLNAISGDLWHEKSKHAPVTITLAGQWKLMTPNANLSIKSDGFKTELTFHCHQGNTLKATLRKSL